jgi:hypothetical protein
MITNPWLSNAKQEWRFLHLEKLEKNSKPLDGTVITLQKIGKRQKFIQATLAQLPNPRKT